MTRDVPSEDPRAAQLPDANAYPPIDPAGPVGTPPVPQPESSADQTPTEVVLQPEKNGLSFKTKLIFAAIGIAILVGLYFWFQQVATRSWGNRVAGWVGDSMVTGIWYGVLFGFVGTVLAIVLILFAIWQWMARRIWAAVPLAILAFAAIVPLIMTFAVSMDSSEGANSANLVMDQHAPGFRGAMLIGAIVGVAFGIYLDYRLLAERRDKENPTKVKVKKVKKAEK